MIAALTAAAALPAYTQTTYSGYFTENYGYRFQMNPAIGNEKGFVSFPGLGNINTQTHGNLNLSDVVYTLNGKTVLFTNPGISAAEVMKNISGRNKIGSNCKFDIMTVGFKAFGGYNAISLSAVSDVEMSVPGSFFSLVKEGVTNDSYDVKDMFGKANVYMQLALNHSHWISSVPGLRVGASLKVLLGAGNVDFRFNEARLELGHDQWIAKTNADIYASVSNFSFDHKTDDKTGHEYVSGGDIDKFGLNGFGLGLDLGAEYIWNDLKFSAAVLDLGFMKWGKTHWASTNGTKTIDTDAYIFNADDDAPNSFDNEWDRFTGDLGKLYQLEDNGVLDSRTRALAATVNLGVVYELPSYRKLHFGLLNSTRINGDYSWTQFRLSANIAPVKFFSADANFMVGSYGVGFGWLINFHTTGFNLFAGMDHTVGKLTKEGVPLNSNNAVNFGINFPFGK